MAAITRGVGEVLDLSSECTVPEAKPIQGRHITLRPLEPAHTDILFPSWGGPGNDDLWTYIGAGPFAGVDSLRSFIDELLGSNDMIWTIFTHSTNEPVGAMGLMSIDVQNRTLELGGLISLKGQRTPVGTETWYLLATKAFESGFRRVYWKCDSLNEASRRAAVRYGMTLEGVFRQHQIVKGHNRDTAWYSVIDKEWPVRKLALEKWLQPDNFDADGKQKRALVALREELERYSRTEGR